MRPNLAKPLNSLSPKRPGAMRSMFDFTKKCPNRKEKRHFRGKARSLPPGFAQPKGRFSGFGGGPLFPDQRRLLCLSVPATPPIGPGPAPRRGDCCPGRNSARSDHLRFSGQIWRADAGGKLGQWSDFWGVNGSSLAPERAASRESPAAKPAAGAPIRPGLWSGTGGRTRTDTPCESRF